MSAATWELPRGLERLAHELLERAGERPWTIDPSVLTRSIRLDGWCAPERASAAERELLRLHRIELAFLLREAANLRIGAAPSASLAAWRTCFREALCSAARDGARASAELFELLRRCRSSDVGQWPAAVELARAALGLHDVRASRERLGEALLAEGRACEARTVFAAALACSRTASECARACAGLLASRRALAASATTDGERSST